MKSLFSFIVFFLFIGFTFAHQPRLIYKGVEQPIIVSNPEISQAFYGNLQDGTDTYKIISETGIHLYAQIVVPMIAEARKDFKMKIYKDNGNSIYLDGSGYNWGNFYEPFAGDRYFQGPSFDKYVSSGVYTIEIFNDGYTGKYSYMKNRIISFGGINIYLPGYTIFENGFFW